VTVLTSSGAGASLGTSLPQAASSSEAASKAGQDGRRTTYTLSITSAMPCPTPMHMVHRP
jgi:hypothetical protein